ncbi:MAG: hypothetical protein LBH15_05130 [Treponema sp.]|jgi:hypothetical protein|nr:hypothetical protein [Treponema sp.]
MKRIFLLGLTLGLFLNLPVFAQDSRPVIRMDAFSFEGLGPQESQIIRTLFQSYLSGLGTLVYPAVQFPQDYAEEDEDAGLAGTETFPDFTFSARVVFDRELRYLNVTVGNTRSGEISSFSSVYKTTGELILKSRAFMESVLASGVPLDASPGVAENAAYGAGRAASQEPRPEPISEGKIIGTWRGDQGIEIARLQRGGRGIAVLSSGARMELSYTIIGDTLFITQDSANQERYYHPLPYQVARALAAEAGPMRWEFLLYGNGTALRGIQITTAARYEGEKVLELIPNSARESGWTKTIR